MRNRWIRASLAAVAVFLWTGRALAEASPDAGTQVFLPANVLLPNNESLPVGALGGLEGNAFTARTNDATAPWFNPAGLARTTSSSASVSAGTFRFVTVKPEGTESTGSSIESLPAAVGFVLKAPLAKKNWTFGFSVARTAAWSQETDFQYIQGTDLRQRTTSSADADFNRTTLALTAGWTKGGMWRFGGGLLVDILNLRSVQSLTYRRETGTYVETGVASTRASGSQGTLRLGLGAQADLSEQVKLGVTLRTPGVCIFPGATYTADLVYQNGAASTQASFFDSQTASFRYKLPFEAVVGLAWVSHSFEIEVDVKGQTGNAAYDGFSSPNSVVFLRDPGDGSRAVITLEPFPGIPFEARSILNVSVGGHLNLDARGIWQLHAGFATDESPVGDGDRFFDRISLATATIGVSGAWRHIAGSLGVTYQFGTSGERPVPDLVGGRLAVTKFNVSNVGILYSVSYVF
ncbi:MAG: hypothetical protein ACHQPI_13190 [Thermoanaerobaculia bacterium]